MPPVCDIGLRGYRVLRSESNKQVLVHLELEREPDGSIRSFVFRVSFVFLRLASILPRAGAPSSSPPSRGVMGARSPHSKGVSLIC